MTETTPDEVIPDTIVCDLSTEIFVFPEQEPTILEVISNEESEPLTYIWSTGSNSSQIVPTQDSLYSVTVTNAYGCSSESTFDYDISTVDCLLLNVEITYVDSIPALETLVSSGIPPFLYTWSEGSTTDYIFITPPGTFSVTVEDANGCIAEDEITL